MYPRRTIGHDVIICCSVVVNNSVWYKAEMEWGGKPRLIRTLKKEKKQVGEGERERERE